MGLGLNIIVFSILLSFALGMYGSYVGNVAYENLFLQVVGPTGTANTFWNAMFGSGGFVYTALALGIVASLLFPNPYAIFQVIVIAFAGYLVLPLGIFGTLGLPPAISGLLSALFIFIYGIVLMSWWKGGSDF